MDFNTETMKELLVFPDTSIFGSFENKRFATIQKILFVSNITLDRLILDKEKVKRWRLLWNDEPADLVWNDYTCERWYVASIDGEQKELTGIWKDFDLYHLLEQNSVDLEDYWYNDSV